MTRTILMRGGMLTLLKNGANSIRPELRSPTTSTDPMMLASEISMSLSQVREEVGENLDGELASLPPHPRHQEKCCSTDCEQTRHGGKGGFLQRSQNLHDIDQQTDGYRCGQNWTGQQEDFFHCVATEIDDLFNWHKCASTETFH